MGVNGRKRRRRRRRRSSVRGPLTALILTAVVLVAAYLLLERLESSQYHEQRSVASENFYEHDAITDDGVVHEHKNDLKSVLVMGVDRINESEECVEMMMLLVMDHEEQKVRWLHINRDTLVGTQEGAKRINAPVAHVGDNGTRNHERVKLAQNLFGDVHIDYYITLHLDYLDRLNEIMGGVQVTLSEDFSAYDPAMTSGAMLRLTGEQAMLLMDDSVSVGDASEESLMKRQQTFIVGLFETFKERFREDSDSVTEIMNRLNGVMSTNFYTAQMLNEFARAYAYGVPEVEMLPGAYQTDETGATSFVPDMDAVEAWAIDTFYTIPESGQPDGNV